MAAWLSAAILGALLTVPVIVRLIEGDRKAATSETRTGRVNVSTEADVFPAVHANARPILAGVAET